MLFFVIPSTYGNYNHSFKCSNNINTAKLCSEETGD